METYVESFRIRKLDGRGASRPRPTAVTLAKTARKKVMRSKPVSKRLILHSRRTSSRPAPGRPEPRSHHPVAETTDGLSTNSLRFLGEAVSFPRGAGQGLGLGWGTKGKRTNRPVVPPSR